MDLSTEAAGYLNLAASFCFSLFITIERNHCFMLQVSFSQAELEKIDQMQENMIAYFRLFAGLPGITFNEVGITWCVTAEGEPGNQVLRTQLPSEEIEDRIDEFIRQIGQ